jgi:nucleoside-diphosphate-sugar epimerase
MAKYEGVIKMRTDGTESRQFLYGDDCADALLTLSKKYNSLDKNKSYHITSFKWVTVLEIAQIIQNISGS